MIHRHHPVIHWPLIFYENSVSSTTRKLVPSFLATYSIILYPVGKLTRSLSKKSICWHIIIIIQSYSHPPPTNPYPFPLDVFPPLFFFLSPQPPPLLIHLHHQVVDVNLLFNTSPYNKLCRSSHTWEKVQKVFDFTTMYTKHITSAATAAAVVMAAASLSSYIIIALHKTLYKHYCWHI